MDDASVDFHKNCFISSLVFFFWWLYFLSAEALKRPPSPVSICLYAESPLESSVCLCNFAPALIWQESTRRPHRQSAETLTTLHSVPSDWCPMPSRQLVLCHYVIFESRYCSQQPFNSPLGWVLQMWPTPHPPNTPLSSFQNYLSVCVLECVCVQHISPTPHSFQPTSSPPGSCHHVSVILSRQGGLCQQLVWVGDDITPYE